jgi:hypothetical protein
MEIAMKENLDELEATNERLETELRRYESSSDFT